jgi:type IV secretion system protein VirD4
VIAVVVTAGVALILAVLKFGVTLGLVMFTVTAAAVLSAWWAWWPSRKLPGHRIRHLRWRLRLRLHPGRGHATAAELWTRWGRFAAFRRSGRARPSLGLWQRFTGPASAYSLLIGRAHFRHALRLPLEEHVVVKSPPRAGKTGWLATVVLRYPGPVVSTTTKADVYENTSAVRSRVGPVLAFNPQRIGGVASTFRWSPLHDCQDPAVAIRRADSFAQAVSQKGVEDGSFWSAKASDYLRGYFHAAALAGLDMLHVAGWATGGNPGEAEAILLDYGAAQWALTLSELRGEAQKTAQTVRMVMTRALSFMTDPALAACVLPGPSEGLDIGAFLRQRGTLYLIAEAQGEDCPVAPLFACLTSEIRHQAALLGSRMPAGRLDPPLLLALDEVTQIAPVPVPSWLADSGGKGIQIITVAHGEAQLRDRWGKDGARVILDTSSAKVWLPGISDPDTLDAASRLCGTASMADSGGCGRHPIMAAEMVRQLPDRCALVLRGGLSPVVARLPMVWKDPLYKRAMRAARRPAVQPAAVPAAIAAASRLALPAGPGPAQAVPGLARGHVTAADGPGREPVTVPAGRETAAEPWWMR